MIPTDAIVLFFVLHFLGDWLFQPPRIALNKSKDPNALLQHASIYTLAMLCMRAVLPWSVFWPWLAINIFCHMFQDWFYYRLVWRWQWENKHWNGDSRFVWIGLDQTLHFIVAVVTLSLLT